MRVSHTFGYLVLAGALAACSPEPRPALAKAAAPVLPPDFTTPEGQFYKKHEAGLRHALALAKSGQSYQPLPVTPERPNCAQAASLQTAWYVMHAAALHDLMAGEGMGPPRGNLVSWRFDDFWHVQNLATQAEIACAGRDLKQFPLIQLNPYAKPDLAAANQARGEFFSLVAGAAETMQGMTQLRQGHFCMDSEELGLAWRQIVNFEPRYEDFKRRDEQLTRYSRAQSRLCPAEPE